MINPKKRFLKKKINQTHNKETYFYALSRMLERASYYGIRSLIILYMIDKGMNMSRTEAFQVYGWFVFTFFISRIIGGLIGDFITGIRSMMIIGGILQAIGAFILCIPTTTGLYSGLVLIAIGGGFYTTNIIANYGKLYYKKLKLLDSGFTILFQAVSIGTFLGTLYIGRIGELYNWTYGFIAAGILALLSIVYPAFYTKDETKKLPEQSYEKKSGINNIIFIITFVSLFWGLYTTYEIALQEILLEFKANSIFNISPNNWNLFDSSSVFIIGVIMAIIWTYFHQSRFLKLLIGFVSATLSFVVLFFINSEPSNIDFIYYLLSLLFIGIAEIHISPLIYSVITQYTKPKYLATLIGLASVPLWILHFLFSFDYINDKFYSNPTFTLAFGTIAFLIISIGIIIYLIKRKKLPTTFYIHHSCHSFSKEKL